MSAHLRPMSMGEILDRTFSLYRSRFRLFVGISSLAALGTLGILVLGLLTDALLSQTTLAPSTKALLVRTGSSISMATWLSLSRFVAWPVIVFAASQEFFGNRGTFRAAIAHCAQRWRSGLAIIASLWAIWTGVPVLIQSVPVLAVARLNASLGLSSGQEPITAWPRSLFFLWLGPIAGLLVGAALWLAVPVWTLEEAGLREVAGRARALVKGAYWRIVTSWFMTALISGVLTVSASFVVFAPYRILTPSTHRDLYFAFSKAIALIPGFTASIFVSPLFPIALTLIYYDQRIRREGFDIETMMEAAGMNPTAATVPAVASVGANGSEEQPA